MEGLGFRVEGVARMSDCVRILGRGSGDLVGRGINRIADYVL